MAAFGTGLIIGGILLALAGIGGFIDTRKVDRRFKTGYKNNEPDARNFRRAGRFLLYGVGICVIGAAINNFTESTDELPPATDIQSQSAPGAQSGQVATSDTTASAREVAKPGPTDAQAPEVESGVSTSKELSQNADATPPVPRSQEQSSQNEDSAGDSTPASEAKTFLTSFDCSRATHDDEIAICSDAGLAAMDRQLSQLYEAAMKTISDPQALKQSESDWVIVRHMCNSDVECLRHQYGERIGQFMGSLGSKPLISSNSQSDKE